MGVTLTVLLWVGAQFLQGYFYTEPSPNLYWQGAAAAAGVITLFLLGWCLLNVGSPEAGPERLPYDTLFRFSARDDLSKKPVEQLWVVKKGLKEPILYKRTRDPKGRYEYSDDSFT